MALLGLEDELIDETVESLKGTVTGNGAKMLLRRSRTSTVAITAAMIIQNQSDGGNSRTP